MTAQRSPTLRFAAHYLEMVAVMIAGMLVLGSALALVATALGAGPDELTRNAPVVVLIGMGFSMTAPMVWWMRWRGHSRAANRDMAASMILPTLAVVILLGMRGIEDLDSLLMIQHLAMLPTMFGAMLLHRREYTHPEEHAAHA